eukprot:SAG31_NODE_46757_length_253_cov_0.662338_1_plen_43_part_10
MGVLIPMAPSPAHHLQTDVRVYLRGPVGGLVPVQSDSAPRGLT